jgi:hypothetical protein
MDRDVVRGENAVGPDVSASLALSLIRSFRPL